MKPSTTLYVMDLHMALADAIEEHMLAGRATDAIRILRRFRQTASTHKHIIIQIMGLKTEAEGLPPCGSHDGDGEHID